MMAKPMKTLALHLIFQCNASVIVQNTVEDIFPAMQAVKKMSDLTSMWQLILLVQWQISLKFNKTANSANPSPLFCPGYFVQTCTCTYSALPQVSFTSLSSAMTVWWQVIVFGWPQTVLDFSRTYRIKLYEQHSMQLHLPIKASFIPTSGVGT